MIKIIEITTLTDEFRQNTFRHADIIITDATTHYALGVGGLPLVGDLQTILDARESELFAVAQEKNNQKNNLLTTEEVWVKLFNSPLAGGWTNDEFQEAVLENDDGLPGKLAAIQGKRAAIKLDWPLSLP